MMAYELFSMWQKLGISSLLFLLFLLISPKLSICLFEQVTTSLTSSPG